VYLAVAASAAGVELVRAPLTGAPSLVMAQQMSAPAIGLGGTWTGTLAAAMGTGGVALLRAPSGSELDKILPAAPPPYAAPVTLTRGQTWTEGALERAWQWSWTASSTSMKFLGTTGPIPDLLVSDGPRALLLRPGNAAITAVGEEPSPPRVRPLQISVAPNPAAERMEITVFDASSRAGIGALEAEIYDVQGRLVRRIHGPGGSGSPLARLTWDGRDDRGSLLGSGRYWLHVRSGVARAARSILILR
jgi:hypothetical protein